MLHYGCKWYIWQEFELAFKVVFLDSSTKWFGRKQTTSPAKYHFSRSHTALKLKKQAFNHFLLDTGLKVHVRPPKVHFIYVNMPLHHPSHRVAQPWVLARARRPPVQGVAPWWW